MRTIITLFAGALACLAACTGTTSPTPSTTSDDAAPASEPAFTPVVHVYAADGGGIFANAYLVETQRGVVAIDGTLRVSDGKAVRAKLDAIGKPLLAVLITHGHPDHYNGVTEILGGSEVPVVAARGVDKVIREHDAAKEKQWSGTFGAEWPKKRTFPTKLVESGDTVTFDGVSFTVHGLGPGESHYDTYFTADLGGSRAAFIGDVVLHGVHAYVTDGHTTEWLANLERLRRELAGVDVLYPGHGTPGGIELLDAQKRYLDAYRAAVKKLAKGGRTLSEADKQALVTEMKAVLPNDKLEFLITLGADPVAAELEKAH